MKKVNMRAWAMTIVALFLLLWLSSMIVCAAAEKPEPQEVVKAAAVSATVYTVENGSGQTLGVLGWCLVGLGTVVVAVTGFLGVQPRLKRRRKRTHRTHSSFGGGHYIGGSHTVRESHGGHTGHSSYSAYGVYSQPKIIRTKAMTVEVTGSRHRAGARRH